MYLKNITSLFFCLVLLAACHTFRKSHSSAGNREATKKETPAPPDTHTSNVLSGMSILTPPSSGQQTGLLNIPAETVPVPGERQLESIREKYAGITMETLRLGHALFNGACTACHAPKSIYQRSKERWHLIIDEMAPLAHLDETEKDAVLQYVLSVKATQPGE